MMSVLRIAQHFHLGPCDLLKCPSLQLDCWLWSPPSQLQAYFFVENQSHYKKQSRITVEGKKPRVIHVIEKLGAAPHHGSHRPGPRLSRPAFPKEL